MTRKWRVSVEMRDLRRLSVGDVGNGRSGYQVVKNDKAQPELGFCFFHYLSAVKGGFTMEREVFGRVGRTDSRLKCGAVSVRPCRNAQR